jgi:hypothetical protein
MVRSPWLKLPKLISPRTLRQCLSLEGREACNDANRMQASNPATEGIVPSKAETIIFVGVILVMSLPPAIEHWYRQADS